MFYNPNMFLAMALGIGLFYLGRFFAGRLTCLSHRLLVGFLFLLACTPSILFLGYYLHLFGEPLWYVEWRSWPFTEVLSSLSALLFGFLAPPRGLSPIVRGALYSPLVLIFFLLLFGPFLKSVFLPVSIGAFWEDRWQDDVCLQTTASTCGAASLATILRHYGIDRTERQVARHAYSCATGTELWYLMRYARQQGLQIAVQHKPGLGQIRTPAIIGTRLGMAGHFVVLLRYADGEVTIGDPIGGRKVLTEAQFRNLYQFDGCALEVSRDSR